MRESLSQAAVEEIFLRLMPQSVGQFSNHALDDLKSYLVSWFGSYLDIRSGSNISTNQYFINMTPNRDRWNERIFIQLYGSLASLDLNVRICKGSAEEVILSVNPVSIGQVFQYQGEFKRFILQIVSAVVSFVDRKDVSDKFALNPDDI